MKLDSLHAKQMCWEEQGGDFGKIWSEVVDQTIYYEKHRREERLEDEVEERMNAINEKSRKPLKARRRFVNQFIKSKAKSIVKSRVGSVIAKPRMEIMRLKGWRQKRKSNREVIRVRNRRRLVAEKLDIETDS